MSSNAPNELPLPAIETRVASMVFRDLDEFSESNGVLEIEFLQLGPAPVDSRLTRVALDRMILMRGVENVPYLARTPNPLGMSSLLFQLVPGGRALWRGREVTQRSLLSYRGDSEHVARVTSDLNWAAVFIRDHALADASIALRGTPPAEHAGGAEFLEPEIREMDALRSAVQYAFLVATSAPQLLETATIRQSIEESILRAAVAALEPPGERKAPDGPLVSHNQVVSRAEEVLAEAIDTPIYVADLCSAAGVSERTLRNAFQSLYGVSPIRLLHLRRLHQVRSALRSDPRASVAEVALRFGFSNLGRFALEYRRLFGERPSHTQAPQPRR